jgi:hypothetical protein
MQRHCPVNTLADQVLIERDGKDCRLSMFRDQRNLPGLGIPQKFAGLIAKIPNRKNIKLLHDLPLYLCLHSVAQNSGTEFTRECSKRF